MKFNSFPGIVKFLLKDLPTNDYPVLNSRLFCSIWFAGILDKGINSLRDLFYQLNHTGIKVDLSTFSKANKTRDPQIFRLSWICGWNCIEGYAFFSLGGLKPLSGLSISPAYHQILRRTNFYASLS